MKESQRLLNNWFSRAEKSVKYYNEFMGLWLAAKRKEKLEDEEMFAIRTLAFALLECRSENEALLVLRYFTKAESRKSCASKPMCGSNAVAKDSRRD